MPVATKRAPKTRPTPPTERLDHRCAACQHRILEVVTDAGELLSLDTSQATWVLTGRLAPSGHHVVVHSRSYPLHHCHS
jgi:hypothetical protein